MFDKTIVALDIETTGTIPGRHEIIEIGAIEIKKGLIKDRFQTLIKPNSEIPLFIQNLTNINNDMVREAPTIEEVMPALKKFIGHNPIIGHNVDFDISFINYYINNPLKNEIYDTLQLARIFLPVMRSHSLSKLTEYIGLTHLEKHRALDDAAAAAELFVHITETLESLDLNLLLELNRITGKQPWPFSNYIESILAKQTKKFPNTKVSEGYIFYTEPENDNGLFKNTEKEKKDNNFPVKLDYKHIKSLLEPTGIIANKFPGFEFRLQQEKILLDISKAFNEQKILLMEAGTGVGKSLSYLIPSIYWSFYNQEKVVIATNTINLQEQLWEKDIPLLKNILDIDLSAAIVKGRNNYICLRKWEDMLDNQNNLLEEALFYMRLLMWLKSTGSGDKSELNLHQSERELWDSLSADSETCLGAKCKYYNQYCFVKKARKKAETSDLLIINHSLLFSDIKTDNRVLPPYQILIVDEAHHLEDEATKNMGAEVSSYGFQRLLKTLYNNQSIGIPGILQQLKNKLKKYLYAFDNNDYQMAINEIQAATENLFALREAAEMFFAFISSIGNTRSAQSEEFNKITYRLKKSVKEEEIWPELDTKRSNLNSHIVYLIENLKKIVHIIDRQAPGEEEILSGEKKDLLAAVGNFKNIKAEIDLIIDQEESNHAYWIESDLKYCTLRAAPINVGDILYGNLMENKKTLIFTSATLTVDDDFNYYIERTGLKYFAPDRFILSNIGSPFEYEQQALLCAVRDLPEPYDDELFIDGIVPFLTDLFRITGGKTLVLFTAHKMLKDVYKRIKPFTEKHNLALLGHGIDGSRNKIINQFKEQNNSILFGANSFWEGIDLPGELLTCVVVVKIPFWPPTMPTIEARLDDLAARDIDGFRNFTLPQAVIRFKQGFGRLIRTQKDRGVVVILDKRIINKKYGFKFLRSLPLKHHFKGEQDIVLQKISDWLEGNQPVINIKTLNSKEMVTDFISKLKNK